MKTTIDNTHRVFLIKAKDFPESNYFCNLADIPKVIKDIPFNTSFIVYEFWNGKPLLCKKQYLNEMFEANQIDFKIKKFIV